MSFGRYEEWEGMGWGDDSGGHPPLIRGPIFVDQTLSGKVPSRMSKMSIFVFYLGNEHIWIFGHVDWGPSL